MRCRILIEHDEDGVFVAECPALPGCISQGETRQEAIANIRDAIKGYLASLKKHKEPVPPSVQEEVAEVKG
jgi:antitoxin HicB